MLVSALPAYADAPTTEVFHAAVAAQYGLVVGVDPPGTVGDFPTISDTPISASWSGVGGSSLAFSSDLAGGTVEAFATADDTSTDAFYAGASHASIIQVQCLHLCASGTLVPIHIDATLSAESVGNAAAFAFINFEPANAGGDSSIATVFTGITNYFVPDPMSGALSFSWDTMIPVQTNYILALEAQTIVHMAWSATTSSVSTAKRPTAYRVTPTPSSIRN